MLLPQTFSSSSSIQQQCHEFNPNDSISEKEALNYNTLSTAELIKIQNLMHKTNKLPNVCETHSAQINQIDMSKD